MQNKDEYLFYWKEKGTMWETVFYFKNGKLHREKGPAIASFGSIYKYKDLDSDLYKESKTPISNPIINDYTIETLPNGETKIIEEPSTVYIDPVYYLDDVEYSKRKWTYLVSRKRLYDKLNKELPSTKNTKKKPKI
jgi:hypothetical protein